jgi:hypothetical protein
MNSAPAAGLTFQKADIPSLVNCLLTALKPADTFVAAEQTLHVRTGPIAWQAPDKLEPVLLSPELPHPMWQALRDISPDWILPGMAELPPNTVSLVRTNQKFIESFLTGLNHEMTRELLWNGYPADQRGTYFRQFWDFKGWTPGAGESARPESAFSDVRPIAEWERASSLGAHTGRQPAREHLVLLVRGDVIARYPNVVVYACKALGADLDDGSQRYPSFQGVLAGDVAYYGFDLDDTFFDGAIRGDSTSPGWFFVLQEHPAEPRFNHSTTDTPNANPGDYPDPSTGDPPNVAAQVASRAYDLPLRVAFRGRDLLPTV